MTRSRFVLLQILLLGSAAALAVQCDSAGIAGDNRAAARDGGTGTGDVWFRPEANPLELMRVLKEGHVSDRWIYHDLNAAREEARKTGKPVLVVFRCVPCGSAPGLDGAVCTAGGAEASKFEAEIRAAGGELDALLDQFVAVRMVKMNGVNRSVFQFDRDVPYVAMFLNADGTVYGRYGTRISNDRKNLPRHNLGSFQQSLRRALDLHRGYPKNQAELAVKRGPEKSPAFTEDMPEFAPFPEKYNLEVKNCIHCHTVGEAELRERKARGPVALRDVWPYPLPHNVGLKIDGNDGLKVEAVVDESAAARAGIQRGDVLLRLAGQPLTSEADIQWALHHAPDQGTLAVSIRRGERNVETAIQLAGDWRKGRVRWRSTMNVLRPDVVLDPRQDGFIIYYPQGDAAKAGLRNGDLVTAIDGRTDMRLEADFLKYIHIDRPQVKTVELTVVRNGNKSMVTIPIR